MYLKLLVLIFIICPLIGFGFTNDWNFHRKYKVQKYQMKISREDRPSYQETIECTVSSIKIGNRKEIITLEQGYELGKITLTCLEEECLDRESLKEISFIYSDNFFKDECLVEMYSIWNPNQVLNRKTNICHKDMELFVKIFNQSLRSQDAIILKLHHGEKRRFVYDVLIK